MPPPAAHPDAERLAALADEPPTDAERAHLAACDACRREREAYVALVALARSEAAGDAGEPPLLPWASVAAALRGDGLVRHPEPPGLRVPEERGPEERAPLRVRTWALPARAARRGWPAGLRAAAALALVVGGVAAGRLSAVRGPWAPGVVAPGPDGAAPAFASGNEARAALARAQREYAQAAAYLASDAQFGDAGAPGADGDADLLRARLSALDGLLPSVREAAREAPQDPAVNNVYLTAYDAREATLRQLGRRLPAGVRLTGY